MKGQLTSTHYFGSAKIEVTVSRRSARLDSCIGVLSVANPVRPYGAGSAADGEVEHLDRHLFQRLKADKTACFDPQAYPPLTSITMAVGTVWLIMRDIGKTRHAEITYRLDVLQASLDALKLGRHRETLLRIVLRNHPQHVHIRPLIVPPGVANWEWSASLGLFAERESGLLSLVDDEDRNSWYPRILFSLTGPEPL